MLDLAHVLLRLQMLGEMLLLHAAAGFAEDAFPIAEDVADAAFPVDGDAALSAVLDVAAAFGAESEEPLDVAPDLFLGEGFGVLETFGEPLREDVLVVGGHVELQAVRGDGEEMLGIKARP